MKLNGKLEKLVTRPTPHFVLTSKLDEDQDNNFRNQGNLLHGQLTPKAVGYGGPPLNRLLQLLGGHQQNGRSTERNWIFARFSFTGNSDPFVNDG